MNIQHFRDLVDLGLAMEKKDPERGLVTFKYHNKVFYKNLWHVSPLLLECRGIVFTESGDLVNRPLKKTFNLGENGTYLKDDAQYVLHRKVNGFMVAASSHNGELVVSTTGTTTSDYARLGESWIRKYDNLLKRIHAFEGITFVFECCDRSDPHIVEEKEGLYLLAMRDKISGSLVPYYQAQSMTEGTSVMFPGVIGPFGKDDVLEITQKGKGEGFMVYEGNSMEPVMKIKTPHYLSRKALARFSKKKLQELKANPEAFRRRLSEEFYGLFDTILNDGVDFFISMEEQERLAWIDNYFLKENMK